MSTAVLIQPEAMVAAPGRVIIDCRFSLGDPEEGRKRYREGHIPGAHYLGLNRDLSGPVEKHGGRHPLPALCRCSESGTTSMQPSFTRRGTQKDSLCALKCIKTTAIFHRKWLKYSFMRWLMKKHRKHR